jgi:hypothetical protein
VRKARVYASEGFDRLGLINLIINLAVFLRNREQTRANHGFKGIRRGGMQHADAEVDVIADIDGSQNDRASDQNPNWRPSHARRIYEAKSLLARYCLISTGVPILMLEPNFL